MQRLLRSGISLGAASLTAARSATLAFEQYVLEPHPQTHPASCQFFFLAKAVVRRLEASGYWADYIDPCSGMSMVHRDTCAVYDEVAALCALCSFRIQNAGCCKVALHPSWGSWVYPATIFAKAPAEVVEAVWQETLMTLKPRHPPYCECCGGKRPGILTGPGV